MKSKLRRKPETGVPVLRGVLDARRKNVVVLCPYCNELHSHGWDPEDPDWAISHRSAHCSQKSPFREDGYYVGLLPSEMLKLAAGMQRAKDEEKAARSVGVKRKGS